MDFFRWALLSAILALSACSKTPVRTGHTAAAGHIKTITTPKGNIPEPLRQTPFIPVPKPTKKLDTYTIVVHEIAVKDLLFSLARDAKINIDIHPDIRGKVSMNAVKQTLPTILSRISNQVDMRYEFKNNNLFISPDSPYFRLYKIDYLNMSREASSSVSVSTQLSDGGQQSGDSSTSISNTANHNFWETLVSNIEGILDIQKKPQTPILTTNTPATPMEPATEENPKSTATITKPTAAITPTPAQPTTTESINTSAIIANPESGILNVRASSRQHNEIQKFLDVVLSRSRKQVLIEMTIAEVTLNNDYQMGVDWNNISTNFSLSQAASILSATPLTQFRFSARDGEISGLINMLSTFGDTKVLSSPKIMALNNQTALIKVVDNKVFFTVSAQTSAVEGSSALNTTFSTTLQTVPVGFVMNVTPQISEQDIITLNIRPTISRILGFVRDPNPDLARNNISSEIPEIQIREMESVLKVRSNETAILGGLMQDTLIKTSKSVPWLSDFPYIGWLFSYNKEETVTTELIIFLRPIVIGDDTHKNHTESFQHLLEPIHQSGETTFVKPQSTHPTIEENNQSPRRRGGKRL